MTWTKHRDESLPYALEFGAELADGETLEQLPSPTVVVTLNGVDKTAEVLDGTPEVQGTAVVWMAAAGVNGTQLQGAYIVKASVTTSSGRILVHTEELVISRRGDARV